MPRRERQARSSPTAVRQEIGISLFRLASGGQRPRQIKQPTAQFWVIDRVKRIEELGRFSPMQRVGLECRSRRFGKPGRPRFAAVFTKIGDIHTEDLAHVVKPAAADAVGGALVFLDLLKGQPEFRRQLFLAHPPLDPTRPAALSDTKVDGVARISLAASPPCRSRWSGHWVAA